jgi:hypothetical protein
MLADKRPLEIRFLKSCVLPLHTWLFPALFYHIRLLTYNLINLIKILVQTFMANGHFGIIVIN